MRNFPARVIKKIKRTFYARELLSQNPCRLWGNLEKHKVGQATYDNIIWRMRIACWITEATNTHLEYVILIGFPSQQCLTLKPPQCYIARTLLALFHVGTFWARDTCVSANQTVASSISNNGGACTTVHIVVDWSVMPEFKVSEKCCYIYICTLVHSHIAVWLCAAVLPQPHAISWVCYGR